MAMVLVGYIIHDYFPPNEASTIIFNLSLKSPKLSHLNDLIRLCNCKEKLILVLFQLKRFRSTLNSSCNYLIAIDALFTSIYQSSNSISMYIVLTGINFINLDICFYLMIYSIFSITMSLCSTFFIGFDRLLSVIFPITFAKNKNSRIILYFSIGISIIYSFYTLWSCMEICLSIPKTQVICSITDCFQKDLGQMSFRNSIIIIGCSTLNYIIIWIVIKYRSYNKSTNKKGADYTQRIFKSLAVIMSMVFAG
ncbi:G_PROTEIN_RECEP_F1_2 domain-containing protein [Meloidogyne graminicola]|uniref:G_PROTEIN_RECEP_F1_2 domain-containing protein n=1 Tax=Meloidogyne graminicola TaxID=189291 RepID=A0A8S9Z9H1_9BILA|nr:G_PROTEIN_RECEP_F1_2 domain-containing protein [Meloidogyne graminicola]